MKKCLLCNKSSIKFVGKKLVLQDKNFICLDCCKRYGINQFLQNKVNKMDKDSFLKYYDNCINEKDSLYSNFTFGTHGIYLQFDLYGKKMKTNLFLEVIPMNKIMSISMDMNLYKKRKFDVYENVGTISNYSDGTTSMSGFREKTGVNIELFPTIDITIAFSMNEVMILTIPFYEEKYIPEKLFGMQKIEDEFELSVYEKVKRMHDIIKDNCYMASEPIKEQLEYIDGKTTGYRQLNWQKVNDYYKAIRDTETDLIQLRNKLKSE